MSIEIGLQFKENFGNVKKLFGQQKQTTKIAHLKYIFLKTFIYKYTTCKNIFYVKII